MDPGLKRASSLLQQGRLPASERLCRSALLIRPGDCDALRILALCRLGQGFPDEAAGLLRKAVGLLPDSPLLWRDLGVSYLHQARDAEARDALREALSLSPDWCQAWVELGIALGRTGDAPGAVDAYQRALSLDPRSSGALMNLGSLHQREGEWEEAEMRFRAVLEVDRNHPDALEQLANCLLRLGRHAQAAAILHRCVTIGPGRSSLWEAMGAAKLGCGEPRLAGEAFSRALSFSREPRLLLLHGQALMEQGLWEPALDNFREAEAGFPPGEGEPALRGIVECLLRLGRSNEAALRMIDPQSTDIEEVFSRSAALHMLGRKEEAVAGYRRVLAASPGHEGASFLLSALDGSGSAAAPHGYLRSLFQGYAPHYDMHYRGILHSRSVPEAAVMLRSDGSSFGTVVDVGCGTGLMGEALQGGFSRLLGIDLSSAMLGQARLKGCYDSLVEGDFMEWGPEGCDTVCAIEVLNYFGDLLPPLERFSSWMPADGRLVFTIEKGPEPWSLKTSGRFSHGLAHVRGRAKQAGFRVEDCKETPLRREGEGWVEGACFLLRKFGSP